MRTTTRLLMWPALLLLACCADLNFYSDEELEPLSVQAYAEATGEHPVITSGPDYEMVQRVARKIAAVTGVDYPWEAKLLDAPNIPNAFCLPNGRIAVYSGILKITQDENGLAAVVGHEVAHATMRHGGKRMTQGQLAGITQQVVNSGLQLAEMDATAHNLAMGALGIGLQYGALMPYSRSHETEADVEGIRYAIRAGYDPNAAPALWERMAALGDSGPEFLSTHPNPLNRAAKLREMIPQIQAEEANWAPAQK